jgi:hypothetical protein
MYRTLLGVILGLLAAALLVGCGGGGGPAPDTGTAVYWPLAVGNVWHYDYTEYADSTAVATAALRHGRRLPRLRPAGVSPLQTPVQDTWTVTGTGNYDDSSWYGLQSQYAGGDVSDAIYLQHASGGLRQRDSSGVDEIAYYLLQLPLEVGHTWTDAGFSDIVYTITSIDATTTVPDGTFNDCIVVEDRVPVSGEPDDVRTRWYAPNVGLVREEDWQGTTQYWELVLTGYTLQ